LTGIPVKSFSFRLFFDTMLIVVPAVFSLAVSAQLALKPRDPSAGLALVFAPWSSAETTFLKAAETGARFVRFGGMPFIAIVMPEGHGDLARVNSAGAWLVADPKAIAACLEAAGRKIR